MDERFFNIDPEIDRHSKNLCNWFVKNKLAWQPQVDSDIVKLSNGKYRVFHTFFNDKNHCLSGEVHIQALSEQNII
jgi:hypothetical protein